VTALGYEGVFAGELKFYPAAPTLRAVAFLFGFMTLAALLDDALPGAWYAGPTTKRGHVPLYRDNAVMHCVCANVIFFGGSALGWWRPTVLIDDFAATISTLNGFALLFCAWLYHKGLTRPDFPDAGPSGRGVVHDFYWGVELYPRCLGRDVKRFCNCRFSMTFWMLHGFSCIAASRERHGQIDPAVVASTISQWVYLCKFFYWEPGYMHSIDIILDCAGFYETWGVLVFVPAMYTIHTRALVVQPSGMGWPLAMAILAASLASVTANYLADRERLIFRQSATADKSTYIDARYTVVDADGAKTIKTTRLLCSGWWGWVRHPQYIFELGAAWSWGLLGCPWHNYGISLLYAVTVSAILIHRVGRDEVKCTAKYGDAYLEYKRRVPWRMLPGVW